VSNYGQEDVMRVEVDHDRCEGNAVCVGIAPDLFDLDDQEYAVVKADPVPAEEEAVAEQAIAECPRAAIIRHD
jgi:ferredoxin